jgi:hypothetical protein
VFVMKKFSKKGVLLFATALAACALAPAVSSAASWSPIGSHHTLDSPNGAFIIDSNQTTSSCGETTFTARVANAMDMEIIGADFRRCTASGPAIGSCTKTMAATNLPWTATPTSTTLVDIRNVHVDVLLENEPGSTACTAAGVNILLTGSVNNGNWSNTSRHLTLAGTTGLVSHSPLGNGVPVTANGTFRDTQQTLQILP